MIKKIFTLAAFLLAFGTASASFAQAEEAKPKSLEQPSNGVLGGEATTRINTGSKATASTADTNNEGNKVNNLSNLENTVYLDLKDGRVVIELLPDLAPNHVARFKELIRQGFYNGVPFHRVIEGFMAQTGDPTGTGRGGSGKNIKAEFSGEKHVRGTLSMARSMDPDSADSQFFICFDEAPHLDGQYTIFGKVVKGMEFVDKIKKGDGPNGKVTDPDKIIKIQVAADADIASGITPTITSSPSSPASTSASPTPIADTAPKPVETPETVARPATSAPEEDTTPEAEENKVTIQEAVDRNNERTANDLIKTEPLVDEKTVRTTNVSAPAVNKSVPNKTPKAPARPATNTKKTKDESDIPAALKQDTTSETSKPTIAKPSAPAKPVVTKASSSSQQQDIE